MTESDQSSFSKLLSNVMAFYRQDVSTFALSVWWQAAQGFEFEQVAKALTAHAMDPDRGQFPPKPADLVRQLQGTNTDRSLIAWGKALEAAQRVGAYNSVCFDDPVIHAVIEDVGGWTGFCRTPHDELSYLQKRFCDSYKAYAARGGDIAYPAKLLGESEMQNRQLGYRSAPPALVGDPHRARAVLTSGSTGPKTLITAGDAVPALRRIGTEAA